MNDPQTGPEDSRDARVMELLSFLVGGQDYCVDIMSVREIRGGARATPLPGAPPYMRGVINLRGSVLPIMDLSRRLGLETHSDAERNVIIVVAIGPRTVGLVVDAVSDILAVPETALQPPPSLANDGDEAFVSALTIVEERLIRVLDLASVMPNTIEEVA